MTTSPALLPFRRAAAVKASAESADTSARWSAEWIYFTFVIAVWCFIPLVRRLLDWHNGFFNPIQITSTIPFIVTLPFALFCFRRDRLARLTPAFKIFAFVWVAAFGYGLIVGLFVDNALAATYSAVQYLVPMLIGVWLAGQQIDHPRLMLRLSIVILVFGGLVGIYGLVQFVDPPPWDVLWIQGGHFDSMGLPLPFQMRTFSTLNSVGPAADFFALGIILALPFLDIRRPWIWPLVGALGAALLLTLVRTSWIGLVVGVIVYLITSPLRLRTIPFVTIFAACLVFLVASLPAFLGAGGDSDVVMSRLSTFTDVGHDTSALDRTQEIQDSFQAGLQNPLGTGLGQIGASSALSANPETASGNVLDSGYMARFVELGWAGFAAYLFVVVGGLITLIASAFRYVDGRRKDRETLVIIAVAASMCALLVWADAAGDAHLGLEGVFFWIAMGIGFRRTPPRDGSREAVVRAVRSRGLGRFRAGVGESR